MPKTRARENFAGAQTQARPQLEGLRGVKHRETRAEGLRGGLSAKSVILAAPDLGREPRTLADLAEIARSLEVIRET